MNIVQFDWCAFILPDDMDAFRKRYGVDMIFLDGENAVVTGIGPNDKEWRELPSDAESGAKVIRLKGATSE